MILNNRIIEVNYDPELGTFTAKQGEKTFITDGRLDGAGDASAGESRKVEIHDSLGSGTGIEVAWPDGRIRQLALYDSFPFVCVKGSFKNRTSEPIRLKEIKPLTACVDAGVPIGTLRGLEPEGLYDLGDRTNFCLAAVAGSKTSAGIVSGWLSHFRGSGLVSTRVVNGSLVFEATCEYGRLLVPPGTTVDGEILAVGYFDDALEGLEMYADGCAKVHKVKLDKKIPSGYCTWYHAAASDQERTARLAEFCGKELKKFGFDFIQIDDEWQVGRRDFTSHKPDGPYPDGMKKTCEKITGAGLVAGLWYIPFGWDSDCPSLKDHADWFVHHDDGSIYAVNWAGNCLDMTNPDARDFLRRVVARISKEWGYKYIKIDGQLSGMAVKMLYPSLGYSPDNYGDAVLHDPEKTQVESYRMGLKLVREAAGDDVFILGCNVPQNGRTLGASFGLTDGMRIGHDVGAEWGAVRSCVAPLSHLYFLHGKVWFNDPDCLMLRDPLTLDQARAWGSLIAISGQMNVVSEWLPDLPPEKLDVIKRTMPNHGGMGRPVDLFENNLPKIWHYQYTMGDDPVDLVGLFNWDEKNPATVELELKRIGLSDSDEDSYVGFDFWENEFVGPLKDKLTKELRASSCRVIALHCQKSHPQLVGTSRHVTQGAVDVLECLWDAKKKALNGRSKVVADDPYELRIVAPEGFRTIDAGISPSDKKSGVTVELNQSVPQVRVTIKSPASREVSWNIRFE